MSSRPIVPSQIRKVFEGRIFTVSVESITLPNGERFEAEIVRHPGSAVLIPVTATGAIVLVRQYRPAIGRFAWELPAGSLKPGEDPQAAASRECQEEIGLIPAVIRHLGGFFPTPGYCDEEMHFYLAAGLRAPRADEDAHQDEDEDIEVRWVAMAELRAMIGRGEIVDLKTLGGASLVSEA